MRSLYASPFTELNPVAQRPAVRLLFFTRENNSPAKSRISAQKVAIVYYCSGHLWLLL